MRIMGASAPFEVEGRGLVTYAEYTITPHPIPPTMLMISFLLISSVESVDIRVHGGGREEVPTAENSPAPRSLHKYGLIKGAGPSLLLASLETLETGTRVRVRD